MQVRDRMTQLASYSANVPSIHQQLLFFFLSVVLLCTFMLNTKHLSGNRTLFTWPQWTFALLMEGVLEDMDSRTLKMQDIKTSF